MRPDCSRTTSCPRPASSSRRSRRARETTKTRMSTRRSSGCSAPVGRKIHAGRSRNDQVAAAFRLYVEDASREAVEWIERLAGAVLDRAEADADTPMPGYTHLQRAQPVTVGHHLLAWVGDARARPRALPLRRRAGRPVAARRGRARRLDAPPPRSARPDAELARRRLRPRLCARLSLCLRGLPLAPVADRRGDRVSGRRASSASYACRRPRRPARR